eukprot:gene7997-8195_t
MYRIDDEEEAEDNVFIRGFDSIEKRSQARLSSERRRKYLKCLARRPSFVYTCKDEQGAQYDLTFFVIGDWGRRGNSNQRKAANMMADVAGCMQPTFIVSTGDNFYSHGLRSAKDPNIEESFSNVYNQPSLQVPWYAVLGNHDYGDGINPNANDCAATSLNACPQDCCYSSVWQYTSSFNDKRWNCQNGTFTVPTGNSSLVDIIMMDTSPFVTAYKFTPWYNNAGGLKDQNPEAIKQQLTQSLAASSATWKLVVGHHPIASFGEHCDFAVEKDCLDMKWLEAQLQAAGVAGYFCGHEHDLQYITKLSNPTEPSSPPSWPVYVVSGGGSDVRREEFINYKPTGGYVMPYMVDDQGFVAVRANSSHLVMHYYAATHQQPVYTAVLAHA